MAQTPHRRRNAKGQGNIRKISRKYTLEDGTERNKQYYEGRIMLGFDKFGKPDIFTYSNKSQEEVQKKLLEKRMEFVKNGFFRSAKHMTVGYLLNEYVDSISNVQRKKKQKSAGTIANYRGYIRNHFENILDLKLSKLTEPVCRSWVNSLPDSDGSTARNVYYFFHGAIKYAIQNKYISTNPFVNIDPPERKDAELRHFESLKEISAFLKEIKGKPYELLFEFSLITGIRESELVGITYSDINFEKMTIHIDQQLSKKKKSGSSEDFKPTKNKGERDVHFDLYGKSLIERQMQLNESAKKAAGDKWKGDFLPYGEMLFPNSTGYYLSYRTVYKNFKLRVAAIGIPELRFHDLRHAYASIAASKNSSIKAVQENLGHATPEFTLAVYTHSFEEDKQELAKNVSGTVSDLKNC